MAPPSLVNPPPLENPRHWQEDEATRVTTTSDPETPVNSLILNTTVQVASSHHFVGAGHREAAAAPAIVVRTRKPAGCVFCP